MKSKKHRVGAGFEPTAPSGLIEHSNFGTRMENAFQSNFINKIFDNLTNLVTKDRNLAIIQNSRDTFLTYFLRNTLDLTLSSLDRKLFDDPISTKQLFLGKITGSHYRSALGGYLWELGKKYINTWTEHQKEGTKVPRVKRFLRPLKKTYRGWKQLRKELQPGWKVFPKNPKNDIVRIFEDDTLSPLNRMERLVQGKDTDRVAFGPQMDWAIPFLGGSNNWKYCYDGIETGWAELNTWIRIGGEDFLPTGSGIAAYTVPLPDSHSRMFYRWTYPTDNIVPQFIETEILKTYKDFYNYGMTGLAQEFTKRMLRDMILLVREMIYKSKIEKYYFGPYTDQFYPYSVGFFAVWDILPMWRGMIPFMKDIRKKPDEIVEAFEFLNKSYTDLMLKLSKKVKAKTALFGNSRGSSSWISPKLFEKVYWPSMKYSMELAIKNNITPMCHFDNDWTDNIHIFADQLPKRSCIFHLDQVDLVKVHDIIGDSFCLMGGMSPALLVNGTPQQVEKETIRYIENIGQDGLIVASGCEYPADIPIQNVYAQKRAIKKSGFFKK